MEITKHISALSHVKSTYFFMPNILLNEIYISAESMKKHAVSVSYRNLCVIVVLHRIMDEWLHLFFLLGFLSFCLWDTIIRRQQWKYESCEMELVDCPQAAAHCCLWLPNVYVPLRMERNVAWWVFFQHDFFNCFWLPNFLRFVQRKLPFTSMLLSCSFLMRLWHLLVASLETVLHLVYGQILI